MTSFIISSQEFSFLFKLKIFVYYTGIFIVCLKILLQTSRYTTNKCRKGYLSITFLFYGFIGQKTLIYFTSSYFPESSFSAVYTVGFCVNFNVSIQYFIYVLMRLLGLPLNFNNGSNE